jgi:hypothetical protein
MRPNRFRPHHPSSRGNPTSAFSWAKHLLPSYFSSEWSFAHFRIPEARRVPTLVHFVVDDVNSGGNNLGIVIVTADGHYFKASFDTRQPGTSCVQEQYICFAKPAFEPM